MLLWLLYRRGVREITLAVGLVLTGAATEACAQPGWGHGEREAGVSTSAWVQERD